MTIAFGDLQGCAQPLRQLLTRIRAPADEPIWFCGDLVNRGPESLNALRTVIGLGARAATVLGNHDLHLLAALSGARPPRRSDTLAPILAASDRNDLTDWLRRRPLAIAQGDFLLVHAGVVPAWDVHDTIGHAQEVGRILSGPDWGDFMTVMYGDQPDRWDDDLSGDDRLRMIVNILTRIRFIDRSGRLDLASNGGPADAPPGLLPWYEAAQRRTSNRTVVFGHWSTLGLLDRPNLIGLDTGCVWGGCLSAMRLESRALYQQRCPTSLAPAAAQ